MIPTHRVGRVVREIRTALGRYLPNPRVFIRDRAVARGQVRIRVYESGELVHEQEVVNDIVIGYDETVLGGISPGGGVDDAVDGFAVGTDNTAPNYQNTNLNNQVYEADLTTVEQDGTDLNITAFLDVNEANGNDLVEGGVLTDSGTLLNHATFTEVNKSDTQEVVFDITLTQDSS